MVKTLVATLDPDETCPERRGGVYSGYQCTLSVGHDGAHMATGSTGRVYFWTTKRGR